MDPLHSRNHTVTAHMPVVHTHTHTEDATQAKPKALLITIEKHNACSCLLGVEIALGAIQWLNTDRPMCFLYKGRHKRHLTVRGAVSRACRTAWRLMGSDRVDNGLIWVKWRSSFTTLYKAFYIRSESWTHSQILCICHFIGQTTDPI